MKKVGKKRMVSLWLVVVMCAAVFVVAVPTNVMPEPDGTETISNVGGTISNVKITCPKWACACDTITVTVSFDFHCTEDATVTATVELHEWDDWGPDDDIATQTQTRDMTGCEKQTFTFNFDVHFCSWDTGLRKWNGIETYYAEIEVTGCGSDEEATTPFTGTTKKFYCEYSSARQYNIGDLVICESVPDGVVQQGEAVSISTTFTSFSEENISCIAELQMIDDTLLNVGPYLYDAGYPDAAGVADFSPIDSSFTVDFSVGGLPAASEIVDPITGLPGDHYAVFFADLDETQLGNLLSAIEIGTLEEAADETFSLTYTSDTETLSGIPYPPDAVLGLEDLDTVFIIAEPVGDSTLGTLSEAWANDETLLRCHFYRDHVRVSLAPGEVAQIEFTTRFAETGTYFVKIQDVTAENIEVMPWTEGDSPPLADAGGPYKGVVSSPITFDASASFDQNDDITSYIWIFGDGTISEGVIAEHSYETPNFYIVYLIVTDDDGLMGYDVTTTMVATENNPPNTPQRPSGPTSGKVNNEYIFTTSTTDPDGDLLYYIFDFGDGGTSFWLGPYASGEECSASHVWFEQGSYQVKVKAQDSNGAESEWSDPLPVSMPLKHQTLLELILEWILHLFGVTIS